MRIQKITPVLFVERIEPALPMWQQALGYEIVAEVQHEGRLGFVLLARGETSVMLQSHASLADDLPPVAKLAPTSVLYIDVASLDEVHPRLANLEVIVKERKTFYGAREVWVRDPTGQVLGFSEHHR
jgi:uncharacterized glyoxalase superfamily protein PhnB